MVQIADTNKDDAHDFFRLEAKCFGMKQDADAIYFWVPMLIHQHCYKAVTDGKTVGGIIAMPTKKSDTWYVNSLFVDEEYRRKGIAGELLKKVLRAAKGNRIVLDFNPERKHLPGFYGKFGFVEKGVSHNHYRDGEDRVTMVRSSTNNDDG